MTVADEEGVEASPPSLCWPKRRMKRWRCGCGEKLLAPSPAALGVSLVTNDGPDVLGRATDRLLVDGCGSCRERGIRESRDADDGLESGSDRRSAAVRESVSCNVTPKRHNAPWSSCGRGQDMVPEVSREAE